MLYGAEDEQGIGGIMKTEKRALRFIKTRPTRKDQRIRKARIMARVHEMIDEEMKKRKRAYDREYRRERGYDRDAYIARKIRLYGEQRGVVI